MIEVGNGWAMHLGECVEEMRGLVDGSIDHIITDPPYSQSVHKSVRSSGRKSLPDTGEFECRTRRSVDLGFEHLTPAVRRACAAEFARLAKRWVMAFSDVESCHLWRRSLQAVGLDYVRTAEWRRLNGAPQFTGDRPAQGFETITIAHPKGRKKWNGGGKQGTYAHPIVQNRGGNNPREHTCPKPEALMLDLVADFTDRGDLVLDPFAGSGTTGVACIRLGRSFIGIERDPVYFALCVERLRAEENQQSLQAARSPQLPLLGGAR